MRAPATTTLLRHFARVRRHTAMLCAALLAHTLWMAASATCEPVSAHDTHATQSAHDAHATHTASVSHAAHAAPSPDDAAPVPIAPPHPVACPMAMACAVSAMQVTVPTLTVRTLALHDDAHATAETMPQSVRSAPEPPPPRG